MAAGTLTSGSWSIAGHTATGTTGKIHENTYINNKQREVRLKLTLACGAIPRGGLALPGAGSIGMHRTLSGYILHHIMSAATARLVTGVVTSNVKNKLFTINVTGNKILAISSTMVTGVSNESFQPLATSIEIQPHRFFMTAYGW